MIFSGEVATHRGTQNTGCDWSIRQWLDQELSVATANYIMISASGKFPELSEAAFGSEVRIYYPTLRASMIPW